MSRLAITFVSLALLAPFAASQEGEVSPEEIIRQIRKNMVEV